MTPIHKVEAIAASTAFPPFFNTAYILATCQKKFNESFLLSTPTFEHSSASTATAPLDPLTACPLKAVGLSEGPLQRVNKLAYQVILSSYVASQ